MYRLTLEFETKQELIGFLDASREPDDSFPPEETFVPTMDDLKAATLAAVVSHRDELREILNEFEINRATECPEDRIADLFTRVRDLG